jgi:hypothetical protein
MGLMQARMVSRAAAGLLALCIGSGGNLLAADSLVPIAPEERSVIEKTVDKAKEETVDKLVEKIGEKIDEKIGEKKVAEIDEAHENQERFFGLLFERVDRVFGEQYVEDRERKVQVWAGLDTTFNDDGTSIDTRVKGGLRVPLPAMKRRLNIFLDIGGDFSELGAVSSPQFSQSEKNFSLAAGLLRRLREDVEVGLKLRFFSAGEVFSVNPFARFEWQRQAKRLYFEEKITWESDNSWSSLTSLDLDYRFRSGLLFRLSNRLEFPFEEPGAYVAHGLILRQGLFDTSGLSLELWLDYNTANDDPATIADDTVAYVQLRLRGRIWRKWLEYELRPIYTFPFETDRKSFFGFFVGLTVIWDSYLGGGDTPDTNPNR